MHTVTLMTRSLRTRCCLRMPICARAISISTLIFLLFLNVVFFRSSTFAQTSTPSPTPTLSPTPDSSGCGSPAPGRYWHFAGVWHFSGFGAYEPRVYTPPAGTYNNAPPYTTLCYYLASWSATFSPYDYNGMLTGGPWRNAVADRWVPGSYQLYFVGSSGGVDVELRTGWYFVPGSASGSLYIWVHAEGSPTPSLSPTPSPTLTPSPSLTPSSSPAPSVDCTRWVDVDDDHPATFRPFSAGIYWIEVGSGQLWWSGQYHGPGVYAYQFDGWGVVRISGVGRVRFCQSDPSVGVTVTRTPTRTPTLTRTPTPTDTPGTPRPTRTPTLTRTPRPTRTPTLTRTPPPTLTPTLTWTPLPSATREPYQPPSAIPRYTLVPITPPPSVNDLDWTGSLVGDLLDGLDALERAVAPPSRGRLCDLPAPVLADAPERYGMRDAFPEFAFGLCAFFSVASPVLNFVRFPVTLLVIGFVFWTAWRVFRSLS